MTIISHQHKFIFVRPPKTASTSILVSLAPLCGDDDVLYVDQIRDREYLDLENRYSSLVRNAHIFDNLTVAETRRSSHLTPEIIRKAVGGSVWDEYYKFTVVRNPWDWFISFYWWKMDDWLKSELRPVRATAPKASLYYALRRWRLARQRREASRPVDRPAVERALKAGWFKERISMFPEFYFIDQNPYADCHLRFENLQPDFDLVCHRLGLSIETLPETRTGIKPKGAGYRDYYTDWSREYIARQCRRMIDVFDYRF